MAVLLDSVMSVHHVAVAMITAVEALDTAVRYLQQTERPYLQLAVLLGTICIVCSSFVCLELKEVDKTFGAHVTPHENCVVVFSVVLCRTYRICP
jgi:hypothetical protein